MLARSPSGGVGAEVLGVLTCPGGSAAGTASYPVAEGGACRGREERLDGAGGTPADQEAFPERVGFVEVEGRLRKRTSSPRDASEDPMEETSDGKIK